METTVEIGGWEHDCCGPAFERHQVVELLCFRVLEGKAGAERLVETHHDLDAADAPVVVRGRVADIAIRHQDGSIEHIDRLPSGAAMRGFDAQDDGHLETPWTGEPVTTDSETFLITVVD